MPFSANRKLVSPLCFNLPWISSDSHLSRIASLSNIPFPTTQTFSLSCSPYIALSHLPHHSPHILVESPSGCVYALPVYFARLFHIRAFPSLFWGKVCLYIPSPQDSGYGGDIWLSRQYGIPFDRLHDPIIVFPCPKHTISPPTHSPTGSARGTLPLRGY